FERVTRSIRSVSRPRCPVQECKRMFPSMAAETICYTFGPPLRRPDSAQTRTTLMESAPKILIVEDDDRTRSLLERYLKEQGFSVFSLSNGRRLDETLAMHPIKLMILDLMLPGEDGLSICRRLRGKGE